MSKTDDDTRPGGRTIDAPGDDVPSDDDALDGEGVVVPAGDWSVDDPSEEIARPKPSIDPLLSPAKGSGPAKTAPQDAASDKSHENRERVRSDIGGATTGEHQMVPGATASVPPAPPISQPLPEVVRDRTLSGEVSTTQRTTPVNRADVEHAFESDLWEATDPRFAPTPQTRGYQAFVPPMVADESTPDFDRSKVRKVYRVLRHIDPWSTFKVGLLFSMIAYLVLMTSGRLLWEVADSTGTLANVERWFTQFGWESFSFDGGSIFWNAAIAGLFLAVAFTGLLVMAVTIFNLVSDAIGGIRVTVLEEEYVERGDASMYDTVNQPVVTSSPQFPADWAVDER